MDENYFRANLRPKTSFSNSRRDSLDEGPITYGQSRPSFSNNDLFKALVSSLRTGPNTQSNCETLSY